MTYFSEPNCTRQEAPTSLLQYLHPLTIRQGKLTTSAKIWNKEKKIRTQAQGNTLEPSAAWESKHIDDQTIVQRNRINCFSAWCKSSNKV